MNSDQHLGVTIVVVVRRIIVAVFRVVVVAVLVPLRPDGQLMSHHHQEEGDQDQQEADQDQTWPIKNWPLKKNQDQTWALGRVWRRHWRRPAPTPSSGADEPSIKLIIIMSMVGVGDDADGGDGDAHHGWSGHPGGGVGGVTALSRCQLCLIYI